MIIGTDKFTKSGPPRVTNFGRYTPIDNCMGYESFGNYPCDSGYVIGEFFENEDVEIKLISEIGNESYTYPVCVRNLSNSLGVNIWKEKKISNTFLDVIPEITLNHIRTGQAKLLVYYGYEEESIHGDSLFRMYDDFVIRLVSKGIPLKNVIYSDANILLNEESDIDDIKMVVSNYCTNTVARFNNEHKQNLYHGSHTKSIKNRRTWEDSRDKIREKYFLCYNRLPKPHRALIVLSLYKNENLDKGLVSFPSAGESSWDPVELKDYLKIPHCGWLLQNNDLAKTYEKYVKGLKDKLPLVLDKKDFTRCHSVIDNNISHYIDTYFTICTESHFGDRKKNGNAIGFTEKTWKPITNFHPFVYVGNANSLKNLKKYGFKTFHPYIDESYDEIYNTGERFLAIENEINKLCNKSLEELHEWYWSIEEVLKHNYFHFYKKFVPDERRRFLDEISN